jgi:S-adenosylmethionine synthetase
MSFCACFSPRELSNMHRSPFSLRGIPHARSYLFTSESVSEGHPDKVCDRISDEIVDLVYREAVKTGVDPWTVRIACETLATTNRVVIAGEVRLPPSLLKKDKNGNEVINPSKFKSAARKAIRDIGYEQDGFHWKTAKIDVLLHSQSADIGQGVDNACRQAGRAKVPATRASCSVTPAAKRRT